MSTSKSALQARTDTRDEIIDEIKNTKFACVIESTSDKLIIGYVNRKPILSGATVTNGECNDLTHNEKLDALQTLRDDVCNGTVNTDVWNIGVIHINQTLQSITATE